MGKICLGGPTELGFKSVYITDIESGSHSNRDDKSSFFHRERYLSRESKNWAFYRLVTTSNCVDARTRFYILPYIKGGDFKYRFSYNLFKRCFSHGD
jgi:hypothetical protein